MKLERKEGEREKVGVLTDLDVSFFFVSPTKNTSSSSSDRTISTSSFPFTNTSSSSPSSLSNSSTFLFDDDATGCAGSTLVLGAAFLKNRSMPSFLSETGWIKDSSWF